MKRKLQEIKNPFGFTIIEIMIVVAIAGLIMVLIVLEASEAQAARRDSERKAYTGQVLQALEEFYKSNGVFPGCISNCDNMSRFLQKYMPAGTDPLTGADYNIQNSSESVVTLSNGSAIKVGSIYPVVFYDTSVARDIKPTQGQIYIATAAWCYNSHPDNNGGPPLGGDGSKEALDKFAIVAYQEKGDYYCVDNYAAN